MSMIQIQTTGLFLLISSYFLGYPTSLWPASLLKLVDISYLYPLADKGACHFFVILFLDSFFQVRSEQLIACCYKLVIKLCLQMFIVCCYMQVITFVYANIYCILFNAYHYVRFTNVYFFLFIFFFYFFFKFF